MFKNLFKSRYSILLFFSLLFLLISFLLRFIFAVWVKGEFDWNIGSLMHTLFYGLIYDISVVSCFTLFLSFYYLILPNKFINSVFDRAFVYFIFTLYLVIIYFTFFAEVTFWDEFKSRFNFIAVDYLIYTYEVVKNIQESYPLPILIGGIVLITGLTLFITKKRNVFYDTFNSKPKTSQKFGVFALNLILVIGSLYVLNQSCPK
ncbi:hypothetical protein SAMN05421738_108187 [Algoriella xinjiangensis]|uniref:Sulfatase n=1 Tax=Algoriella xinjiangensis TaxID=684065 RepID=A0A1I4XCJ7_9FLAO|nr:hypothetical protein [Algoriella xinjiangensis]SFN23030.1 hypothetical protein SAMN05421738_108187 [Algoriella xinjiangensis]